MKRKRIKDMFSNWFMWLVGETSWDCMEEGTPTTMIVDLIAKRSYTG